MIALTINLENEQLLNGTLQNMFESLPASTIELIAEKALLSYLTDTVDYERERYRVAQLELARENGLTGNSYSYYNKTKEEIQNWTDEQLMQSDGFKVIMNKYVSPKQSTFDKLNVVIAEQIKEKALTYVKESVDLNQLIEEKQNIVKETFPQMVSDVISSLAYDVIMSTIDGARMGGYVNGAMQSIQDILQRNNIN